MTTRKTLRDFFQSKRGTSQDKLTYKISNGDLDKDVISDEPLLDFSNESGGLLGDYLNHLTENNKRPIKGGNFIQFSNHDKIYVVAADGGSDGSGNCKIRFEPGLITAITSSETLNTFNQDIPMHAIFASDKIQFDVNSALLYGFKVNFVEQWTN